MTKTVDDKPEETATEILMRIINILDQVKDVSRRERILKTIDAYYMRGGR